MQLKTILFELFNMLQLVLNMRLFKCILTVVILFFVFNNAIKASNYIHKFDEKYTQNKLLNSDDKRLVHIKNLLEKGRTEEALNNLYDFIKDVEKNKDTLLIVESHKLLADILRDNGDYLNSNLNFSKIIPFIKNDYKSLQFVYFKKGGNFQLEGQLDSAKVNYEKAILASEYVTKNEDLKAKIHANLSGIFYLKENYTKAIEHSKIAANYQKVLGNREIEAGILNNLGGIYYMQGKYHQAEAMWKKTVKLNPNYIDAYNKLLVHYLTQKNFRRADEYRKILLQKGASVPERIERFLMKNAANHEG